MVILSTLFLHGGDNSFFPFAKCTESYSGVLLEFTHFLFMNVFFLAVNSHLNTFTPYLITFIIILLLEATQDWCRI